MNDQPATKQDLRDLDSRIDGKLDALKQEMMQFSRDLQTELLRGIERLLGSELLLRPPETGA
jgi:hypothetical protein